MNEIFLFTCAGHAATAARTYRAFPGWRETWVADGELDRMELAASGLVPEGVRLIASDFDRDKNLNGWPCLMGMCVLFGEAFERGALRVVKRDSDTRLDDIETLCDLGPDEVACMVHNTQKENGFGSGYALAPEALPILLRGIERRDFFNEKVPEDQCVSHLLAGRIRMLPLHAARFVLVTEVWPDFGTVVWTNFKNKWPVAGQADPFGLRRGALAAETVAAEEAVGAAVEAGEIPVADPFDDLAARDVEYLYFPNPGNGGDALIVASEVQQFKKAGIRWALIDAKASVTGRHVIHGGGGGLSTGHPFTGSVLKRFLDGGAASVTVLGASFHGFQRHLVLPGDRLTLYARDKASYARAAKHLRGATVRLAHDSAFAADLAEWMALDVLGAEAPDAVAMRAFDLFRKADKAVAKEARTLRIIRADAESTGRITLADALDVSAVLHFGGNTHPSVAPWVAAAYVQTVARFEAVETDRLHGSIVAYLLGKSLLVHDSRQGKVRSVVEHTMTTPRAPITRGWAVA